MKLIAITSPSFFEGEASFLDSIADGMVDLIHLRKPEASAQACRDLITKLSPMTRKKVVVHQHFSHAVEFSLYGLHLNHRNPKPLPEFDGSISRSCHSLEEVVEWKSKCNYVFLSPIFDSISKSGYGAAFTPETLSKAAAEGIIDSKVYALGGVSPDKFHLLEAWNFGGAAMLGYLQRLANGFVGGSL